MRREGVEEGSDAFPSSVGGSFCGLSQEMFELGEDLLDGVQVGAIGWQEQQARTDISDCPAHGGPFVTAQIVHDHDIARFQDRHQKLLDIIGEALTIDRLIEHARCIDPVMAQGRKEGHRAPMAIGHLGMEPPAPRRPTPQRGHVGFGPGLVDEDQAPGIKSALILLPLFAPARDLWPELLGRQHAFF